jgi:hypothetical protein
MNRPSPLPTVKSAWKKLRRAHLSLPPTLFSRWRKILSVRLDRLEEKTDRSAAAVLDHENIRGGQYYH